MIVYLKSLTRLRDRLCISNLLCGKIVRASSHTDVQHIHTHTHIRARMYTQLVAGIFFLMQARAYIGPIYKFLKQRTSGGSVEDGGGKNCTLGVIHHDCRALPATFVRKRPSIASNCQAFKVPTLSLTST